HGSGRGRGDQPDAEPRCDGRHPALEAVPVLGHAGRGGPWNPRPILTTPAGILAASRASTGSGQARTADIPTARTKFPDWRFAPNIGGHPDVYEIENRALDPDGHVLGALRNLAPWDGRT